MCLMFVHWNLLQIFSISKVFNMLRYFGICKCIYVETSSFFSFLSKIHVLLLKSKQTTGFIWNWLPVCSLSISSENVALHLLVFLIYHQKLFLYTNIVSLTWKREIQNIDNILIEAHLTEDRTQYYLSNFYAPTLLVIAVQHRMYDLIAEFLRHIQQQFKNSLK